MSIRDNVWGTGKKVSQEEVAELTNQFYVTLRASFAQIKRDGDAKIRNQEAFNRVRALLEPAQGEDSIQNWTNAYEIEQLLVHLLDDDTVETELAVRILEARSILRPELAAMYDARLEEIQNPPAGGQNADPQTASMRRRRLLARLVNDLQWRYIVNEATRRYSKLITKRTATLSVTALIFFVVGILMLATKQFHYGDLQLLWVAGLAGTWGATFSMLATVKSRLGESQFDDLKLMKAGSVLLSRAAIGAGAACILFFFLLSGLLAGSAFPSLAESRNGRQNPVDATAASTRALTTPAAGANRQQSTPTSESPALASAESMPPEMPPASDPDSPAPLIVDEASVLAPMEIALLIVWCFIAGFSEQLIPGLLATTEARAGSPAPSTTDRFRPTVGATQVPPPAAPQPNTPPPQAQSESKETAGKSDQEQTKEAAA